MIIVVADTSPINYLILIGEIELLAELYKSVIVPSAVAHELRHLAASERVRTWIANPPKWLEIRYLPQSTREELRRLDPGEREAIELALQTKADLILIEKERGRQTALALNLRVRGTLGILIQAARCSKLDLHSALAKLKEAGFYLSPELLQLTLQLAEQRDPL
jgi:predicted nucleic acid-binding protein